jgi:C1A family cysteine protease
MPVAALRRAALNEHGFGWRPDLPDWRDHLQSLEPERLLPQSVRLDLDPAMPPVYDQLRLGSCTANALACAMQFDLRKQGLNDFMPSRLFIYYNERVLERTTEEDAGAEIRDGAKTLHRMGVCSEQTWPYDVDAFTTQPPLVSYVQARDTKSVGYGRVPRRALLASLADGIGFTVGFTVYDSFRNVGDNGVMPLPGGDVLGGHAVFVCGYETLYDVDGRLYFRVRNSWGPDWGDAGYFWMPEHYLHDTRLSQDFWAIRTVS